MVKILLNGHLIGELPLWLQKVFIINLFFIKKNHIPSIAKRLKRWFDALKSFFFFILIY
jgi:hypothetical protein